MQSISKTLLYTFLQILATFLLLFTSYIASSTAIVTPVQSFAALPHQYIETKIQGIQEAFEQRAVLFLKGRNFQPWRVNKPKEEILKEFNQLNEWRYYAWYVDPTAKTLISRTDFMVAQELLEKGYYQKPNLIAFQYNLSDPTYNASIIVLSGFRFLALEAPTAKTIRSFYNLLQNFHIKQLVRLAVLEKNGISTSYSYWKDKIKTDTKTGEMILNAPQPFNPAPYPILYYTTAKGTSNQIDPIELLKVIQKVRKNDDSNTDMIACHCDNETGQTGTFLAGFLLLTEIDRQIASGTSKASLNISIEKIVMQLSLQRPYMVSKSAQYVTLYRLVDAYIQQLK
jgi:hypothetical protein